jgi:membrane protein implicated in regulation of membrane protease activity
MNADLLSGLLLAVVVLVGAGYLIKEIFGPSLASFLAERRALPPAGANDHLIGAVGRIVDSGERSGKMRVRVGMERWSARLAAAENGTLPVGTEVEIKAVEGRVLEVAERAAP